MSNLGVIEKKALGALITLCDATISRVCLCANSQGRWVIKQQEEQLHLR
jgi:hypothetical protein